MVNLLLVNDFEINVIALPFDTTIPFGIVYSTRYSVDWFILDDIKKTFAFLPDRFGYRPYI